MLHVVSGLPGHGKTLFTLAYVEKMRKETGRPVYVHGVSDLTLQWLPLPEPKEWNSLPDGSIVVIDEAWKTFPKRSSGAAVPRHVEQLATHRHRGFDLFLVTQHPLNQLDHFVRGLVGKHFHVRRVFGSDRARLSTWERCANPDISFEHKDAVKSWFSYPKEVYSWYKSAEIHTHKRQLPWKILVPVAIAVVALPLLFFGAFSSLTGNAEEAAAKAGASRPGENGDRMSDGAQVFGSGGRSFRPEDFIPAVAGIPFTAPAFAEGAKVSHAPKVSGCGILRRGSVSVCKCNDQQGNVLDLEQRQCMAYYERGAFDPGSGSRYPVIEPYVPPLAPPLGGGDGQAGSQPADRPAQADTSTS